MSSVTSSVSAVSSFLMNSSMAPPGDGGRARPPSGATLSRVVGGAARTTFRGMSEPTNRAARVEEVAPGLHHWTLFDDRIAFRSDAWMLDNGGGAVMIDPL